MGFQKWITKNGPGSIGDTAKFFSKYYNRLKTANPQANWLDLFLTMYLDRVATNARFDPGNKRMGSLSSLSNEKIEKVLLATKGDLPLFVYLVTYLENRSVQAAYFDDKKMHLLSIEVIHEVVSELSPSAVKFNKEELWLNGLQTCVDNHL